MHVEEHIIESEGAHSSLFSATSWEVFSFFVGLSSIATDVSAMLLTAFRVSGSALVEMRKDVGCRMGVGRYQLTASFLSDFL